jgi:integrase
MHLGCTEWFESSMVHDLTHYLSVGLMSKIIIGALFGASGWIPEYEQDMIPKIKQPKLNDRDGDLSKPWYIEFGAWDKEKKCLKRRKYVKGINNFKTAKERYAYAERKMLAIRAALARAPIDASPERGKKPVNPLLSVTLPGALAYVMERKEKELSRNWLQTYRLMATLLSGYYGKRKPPLLSALKMADFTAIMEWIQEKQEIGPKTYNEYLGILASTVGQMLLLDVVSVNHAARVPKKRVPKGERNIPFSPETIKKIKEEALKDGQEQFVLFMDFCLYTLARPRKELHFLRVHEIRDKSIFIPKERGKTGGRSVPILPPLQKLIDAHGLRDYPGDFYVFGKAGKPSDKPFTSTHFYDYLMKYLRRMGINEKGHTLYALKHSGACICYMAGVPVSILQRLIGHESASQTEEYLVNLGLINPTDLYLGNWPEY